MIYVALLRGVNVGGKGMVSMADLKVCFEKEGYTDVKTYINSGNILFSAPKSDTQKLATQLEKAIERDTKLHVRVLVKTDQELHKIEAAVPKGWDDPAIRCYVLFLWPASDTAKALETIPTNPAVEQVKYVPGVVLHMYDKKNASKSRLNRLNGTQLYQDITIRNLNTLRKLVELAIPHDA